MAERPHARPPVKSTKNGRAASLWPASLDVHISRHPRIASGHRQIEVRVIHHGHKAPLTAAIRCVERPSMGSSSLAVRDAIRPIEPIPGTQKAEYPIAPRPRQKYGQSRHCNELDKVPDLGSNSFQQSLQDHECCNRTKPTSRVGNTTMKRWQSCHCS